MNNNSGQVIFEPQVQHQQASIGVGDYYANPQKEVMQWAGVFYEGRFFLTDPKTFSKLQQVEAQVQLEKKIMQSYKGSQRNKAESLRSFDSKLQDSGYSYATVHNAQKTKIKQFKAEKDLVKEQEINFKNFIEAKHKKKQQVKKPIKNMIEIKNHQKDDVLSAKGQGNDSDKIKIITLNQSMMNKLHPYKETHLPVQGEEVKIPPEQVKKDLFFKRSHKQSVGKAQLVETKEKVRLLQSSKKKLINQIKEQAMPGSMVMINPDEYNKDEKVVLQSYHPKVQQIQISIAEPKQNNKGLNVMKFQTFGSPKAKQVPKNEVNDESFILNNLMIRKPQEDIPKEPSILDLESQEQCKINKEVSIKQRAGDSFFQNINSQMYKMQSGLDNIENKEQKQSHKEADQPQYKQTETMQDTKFILKEIEDHLKIMGLDSENSHEVSYAKEAKAEDFDKNQLLKISEIKECSVYKEKPVKKGANKIGINQNVVVINVSSQQKSNQKEKDSSESQTIFRKRKQFRVNPSIINYQISQNVIGREESNLVQKQKLQKQITVLQQVIGELRVERVKYQAHQSQQQQSRNADQSHFNHYQQTDRQKNRRRMSDAPSTYQRTHRPMGTFTSNFQESVVSEFQTNTRSKLVRNKSGRIVKNLSADKNMPQIEEQKNKEEKPKPFIKDLNIQRNKSRQKQLIIENEKESSVQDISAKVTENNEGAIDIKVNTVKSISQQQKIPEQTVKQPQRIFRITTTENKNRSSVSEPKNNTIQVDSTTIVHEDTPLPNKSFKYEDLQSSMPRNLLNKLNYSLPPKITIQEQNNHKKIHQQELKKQLMSQFQKTQQIAAAKKVEAQPPSQTIDPKRRAMRQGLFKTLQSKKQSNPESNKMKDSGSNIKSRPQRERKSVSQVHSRPSQKSIKNFRVRKDSAEGSHHSCPYHGGKLAKSGQHTPAKAESNLMYVPAFSKQKSFHNQPSQQNESKLYEMKFQLNQKQKTEPPVQGFSVDKRAIAFSNIQIPVFPDPPSPNVTVEQMAELIREICKSLNFDFQDKQIHKLIMKKYKNCIMLDLPTESKLKLVWHYTGKLYVGEWNETTMMKQGQAIEYLPKGYYYKGQFIANKKGGTGVMLMENGSRYEGQWNDGEKHGRGKYDDKSSKYYYQGQWKEGKKQGFGYLELQNYCNFEGTFLNNHRSGHGTETFKSGDSYKGQYERGKFHGRGLYAWASGDRFDGHFMEGVKQGQGKWQSEGGESFIGQYFKDKKHGYGKYKWQNGTVFEGHFEDDKQHGKGILRKPDGQQIEGIWQQGKLKEVIPVEQSDEPLKNKKSKVYEQTTLIKVTQTKPQKLSAPGGLHNV